MSYKRFKNLVRQGYKIIFERLCQKTIKSNLLIKINNSLNKQYLQCANFPYSIKFQKIQGTRSIPYVLPYILALFLSPKTKNYKAYRDIFKCCFCFCSIRQTSDDLKDLEDDILNQRITLPTLLFNWQKDIDIRTEYIDIKRNIATNSNKISITEKSLEYCREKIKEIKIINDKYKDLENDDPIFFITNYWHDISSKIILSIEEYYNILTK